ncbi:WD40 repeat-containing protein [Mycoavidus cysteinexigens]|uniref:WD40 repeat-containing protein n=1 Tax=Mycoavidus cysteinexigens TaxID=1553431 RepID=A0A2Z6ET01_9BURK|nr:NACHT domain-containing protein [Mycoavidus cysteinexigens]BBE08543.1 WD40 repeat-containing protein [Mycoavidus cysteinexigens]GAM52753.1 hypothetical protein EBME_1216 [bacterium endosymbiont of Mortierella elongata FMR23-6]GLR01010.1 hypothetical protein GCM10007934_08220 [Mycoavidus cysteinexigens]
MLPINPSQNTQPSLSSYFSKLASYFSSTQARNYDSSESMVQIGNGLMNNLVIGTNNTANNHIYLAASDSKLLETLMLQHIFALQPSIKPLVNLDSAIEKLQKRYLEGLQEDNEIKDALSNYVAPEGMELHDPTRFDLKRKVQDFLSSDKKVLLLLGEAGSGKSTFNRDLAVSLWEAYLQGGKSKNMPIPVFIGLSSLSGPVRNLVSAFFEKQGFSKEQIKELQSKHRFVLILDGFDEIEHRQQIFYKDNELDDWKGSKIIISSRPEYLGPNHQYKFHSPGERTTLQEYRLAPFSEETIKRYIDRYSKTNSNAVWSAERYKEALEEPSLKELVSNPFLLKITLNVLPELSQRGQTENQRLTRIAIYDQFVKSWFDRSQQRLDQILELNSKERAEFKKLEREGFADFGVEYSQELALEMYQAGEVVTHYQAVTHARWKKNDTSTEADWHKRLLSNEDATTMLMRLNAPLICQNKADDSGKEYRFIHKSLRDYFVARALWEELGIDVELKQSAWFNQINIVKDPAVLQYLAEQVQLETELKERLLKVVERSKEEPELEVGAANALTILVKSGVYLSGKDFNGIRARGADLSYGIFDLTQFKGADLKETNWYRAWLRGVNLNGANLAGIELGEKPTLKIEKEVYACCYSPDGRWLAVANADGIGLYGTETLELVHTYGDRRVMSVAFSCDGQWLASGSKDSTVALWGVSDTRALAHIYRGHEGGVKGVAFSHDSQWVASGSDDKTVKLWGVSGARTLEHTYAGHKNWVSSIAFSHDSQWLASGSWDKTVKLWSVGGTKDLVHTYTGHKNRVKSIAFSPDGQWVASGSDDEAVKLWSVFDARALAHTYAGHKRGVNSVAFSPDGQWVVSGSDDEAVKLWSVGGTKDLVHTYIGHKNRVKSIAFSHDSQWIASGSDDKTVKLWGLSGSRAIVHTYHRHKDWINSVAFSSDGQFDSGDNMVKLWSISNARTLAHVYVGHEGRSRVAVSPNGQWVASSSDDKTVKLWSTSGACSLAHIYANTYTGEFIWSFVTDIAFSSDSQWIALGTIDNTVLLWGVSGARALAHTYGGHQHGVMSVTFSSDGLWLASGSYDTTVKLWHVSGDRSLAHTYAGHTGAVNSVAFSSDGQWLASGSYDTTVKSWPVSGDRSVAHTYTGHTESVNSVAFSADGQWLASGSLDNTVRLWSVRTSDCQAILQDFGSIYVVAWQISPDGTAMLATGGQAVRLWRVFYNSGQIGKITLDWTSRQDTLTVTDALIENARNLSPLNAALLRERGAGQAQISE